MSQYSETTVKAFDDAPIWYRSLGSPKDPVLVLCDGVGCEGYIWKYFLEHFQQSQRILHWNYRGHGKTPAPGNPDTLTVEQFAEDLKVVLDDAGVERPAVILGHSMGVQVIFEFYHRYPERVTALIPVTGSYGKALDHVHDTGLMKQLFPYVKSLFQRYTPLAEKFWERAADSEFAILYSLFFEVNPRLVNREDFAPYFDHLKRMDPLLFMRCLEAATLHTAESYLPEVSVPVLIVASERDRFTPFWISRRMRALIPHSEFLTLPTGTHVGPIELPELVNLRIEKFLANLEPAAPAKAARGASAIRKKKRPAVL